MPLAARLTLLATVVALIGAFNCYPALLIYNQIAGEQVTVHITECRYERKSRHCRGTWRDSAGRVHEGTVKEVWHGEEGRRVSAQAGPVGVYAGGPSRQWVWLTAPVITGVALLVGTVMLSWAMVRVRVHGRALLSRPGALPAGRRRRADIGAASGPGAARSRPGVSSGLKTREEERHDLRRGVPPGRQSPPPRAFPRRADPLRRGAVHHRAPPRRGEPSGDLAADCRGSGPWRGAAPGRVACPRPVPARRRAARRLTETRPAAAQAGRYLVRDRSGRHVATVGPGTFRRWACHIEPGTDPLLRDLVPALLADAGRFALS